MKYAFKRMERRQIRPGDVHGIRAGNNRLAYELATKAQIHKPAS